MVGRARPVPAHTEDSGLQPDSLHPKLLEVSGLNSGKQPIDGESLVQLFKQGGELKRKAIYFHYPNYAWHMSNRLGSVIREGDWKLIRNYDDNSVELYNLPMDLSEKKNVAKQNPKLAACLNRKLSAWLKETGASMPRPPKPAKAN